MNRIVFAVSALLIATVVGGLAAMQYVRSDQPVMRTTGTALVGGPFRLTNHKGKQVTDEDFRGRHMLVFFGYTYCPDVCPAGLQVMTSALEQLGSKADTIQPLFITIDPERDTVPVLATYMEHFHPRLIGLTGKPDEIAETILNLLDNPDTAVQIAHAGRQKVVDNFHSGISACKIAQGLRM